MLTARRTFNVAYAIQDLIFGTFIGRAGVIGGRGVHELIGELMRYAAPHVRFSAFGHSLGAHVMQVAMIGYDRSYFSRKIQTLLLAQGACTTRAVSRGGPYRPLVSKFRPVAGPILCTMNRDDFTPIGL